MVKGIFHCPSSQFSLAKSLGFTHTEVSYTAYPGPPLHYMLGVISEARKNGLFVIVNPGFDVGVDHGKILEFLRNANLGEGDMILLSDEPNLKGIPPETIRRWDFLCQEFNLVHTMITLSWVRTFSNYANTCDILAFDFYKRFTDVFSLAKLTAKVLWTGALHTGEVMAVPAIRYSSKHLMNQFKFWRLLGVNDFFWYSFSLTEEKPPWAVKNLDGMLDFQETLRRINETV